MQAHIYTSGPKVNCGPCQKDVFTISDAGIMHSPFFIMDVVGWMGLPFILYALAVALYRQHEKSALSFSCVISSIVCHKARRDLWQESEHIQLD